MKRAAHWEFANYNDEVAGKLVASCCGWATTALFYAAVHYVNSYLGDIGPSHPQRASAIMANTRTKVVFASYRTLKSRSEGFRYSGFKVNAPEYEDLRKKHLTTIRNWLDVPAVRDGSRSP